jgi:hypothetical protein
MPRQQLKTQVIESLSTNHSTYDLPEDQF